MTTKHQWLELIVKQPNNNRLRRRKPHCIVMSIYYNLMSLSSRNLLWMTKRSGVLKEIIILNITTGILHEGSNNMTSKPSYFPPLNQYKNPNSHKGSVFPSGNSISSWTINESETPLICWDDLFLPPTSKVYRLLTKKSPETVILKRYAGYNWL